MSLIARIIRCTFALYYEFLVLEWADRPETMPHSFVERLLLLAALGFRAGLDKTATSKLREACGTV